MDSVVIEDYQFEDLWFESGYKMTFDAFLPNFKLVFEYQGEQHYHDIFTFGEQQRYARRDAEKRKACSSNGISLIEVPYWWDFTKESLMATIHQKRPDLIPFLSDGIPIPIEPPLQKGS